MWHSADTSVVSSSIPLLFYIADTSLFYFTIFAIKQFFSGGGISRKWCYLLFPHSNWIYQLQLILSLMCKERVCLNGSTIWRKTNSCADSLLFVSFLVNHVSKDFLKYYLHITMNPILWLNKTKYLHFFIFLSVPIKLIILSRSLQGLGRFSETFQIVLLSVTGLFLCYLEEMTIPWVISVFPLGNFELIYSPHTCPELNTYLTQQVTEFTDGLLL